MRRFDHSNGMFLSAEGPYVLRGDVKDLVERYMDVVSKLLAIIDGQCMGELQDVGDEAGPCNGDPNKANCEGHTEHIKRILLRRIKDLQEEFDA